MATVIVSGGDRGDLVVLGLIVKTALKDEAEVQVIITPYDVGAVNNALRNWMNCQDAVNTHELMTVAKAYFGVTR